MKKAKRFISIFMAMLMCLSPMWSGLSVISFAVEERTVVESGECFNDITWVLYDDGELVISGSDFCDVSEANPFYDYRTDILKVTIEHGITGIGDFTFYGCENLTQITMPNTIKSIGYEGFYNCKSLASITIPYSVTSIGGYAFRNCSSLTDIYFTGTEKQWNSISISEIQDESFLNAKVHFAPPCLHENKMTQAKQEATCTEDGYTSGVYCEDCKEWLEGHEKIEAGHKDENNDFICDACKKSTLIASGSFNDDNGVIWDLYSNGYLKVSGMGKISGSFDYSYVKQVKKIEITDGITGIDSLIFEGCENLTDVILPESLREIGQYAFGGCKKLSNISLPNGLTKIDYSAFLNCNSLTEIVIPKSVTSVVLYAFAGCDNLEKIIVDPDNEYYSSEDGVLFNKDKTKLVMYPEGKTDKNYTVPDSVKTIDDNAFSGCTNIEAITIGRSVKTISYYAFEYCKNIQTVYYLGTQEQWNNIIVSYGNDYLLNADIVFAVICSHENNTRSPEQKATCTENGYTAGTYCEDCEVWVEGHKTIKADHKDVNADDVCDVCEAVIVAVIQVNETKRIDIVANKITYIKFIPTVSGNYTFSSVAESDTYGYLFDANKNQITYNDDGYNRNFLIKYRLEAGKTYYWGARYYSWSEGSFEVTLTYELCSHKNTTLYEESPASCTENGYTEGTYCEDCDQWLEGHEIIEPISHKNKIEYSEQNATCTESGYTAGVYCPDCVQWLEGHELIDAEHIDNDNDKICDKCKEEIKTVIESGKCGEDARWTLYDDGELLIYGVGAMDNYYDFEDIPWYSHRKSIVSLEIKDGITSIASFSNCENMVSAIIADSVTSIGGGAFYNCKSLTEINIPENVSFIGELAFEKCYGLTKFIVDENNAVFSSDNHGVLFNKEKTCLIQYPKGNTSIMYSIPDSVESVSMYAIDSDNLIILYVPANVKSMGEMAVDCKHIGYEGTEEQWNSLFWGLEKGAHPNFNPDTDITSVVVKPTCAEDGYTAYNCSCGYSYKTDYTEATGLHNYESVVTEPTCTQQGFTTYTCTGCDSGYSDDIVRALGHDYSEEWTIDKESTCTEDGSKSHHCNRCDYKEDVTVIPAHGHNYESVVTDPTCTKDGYTTYTCLVCKDTYKDNIVEAPGHKYSEWKEITAPSCTKKGLKEQICSVCEDVKQQEIDAHGHNYESVVTKPTCTKDGYTTHTCLICKDAYKDTIVAALGHNYSEWKVTTEPTCTKTGIEKRTCSRCSNVESQTVAALGHDYSKEWTIDKKATCTVDGSKSHHCSRCNDKADVTVIPAHGHNYESVVTDPTCTKDGYTTHTCSICKDTYKDTIVEALGHAYGDWKVTTEPTCTKTGIEKRTCSRCSNVESQTVAALGHNYSTEWTIDKKATCTEDGSKSHHCSRCNDKTDVTVIPAHGHNYESVVTDPTCTKEGYTTHTCSICKDTYKDTIVAALGHNYGEWKVTAEPTCTKKGIEKRTCARCSNVESQDIAALGHNYSKEWTIDKKATCTVDGSKSHHCSRCNEKTDITVIDATGHNYGDWIIEKEATIFVEGSRTKACSACKDKITETIEKTKVNIDETEDYGLANFTVVNAQSLEPIEGASIYILTETDGDTTLYTDENGKVSSILPVGKFTVSAYAKDCNLRNLKITVKPGINDMPKIGLSNQNVYDVELDHHPMTDEEIKDAGIDTSAPGNNHVYKYELKLNFEPQIDWMSICYYMNTNGEIVGGGGSDSNGKGGWVNLPEGGGYYHKPADKEKNEEAVSVYPISEYFYLIVYGDIKWLKEMFDVEMLVINNSNTDTLEELVGTLNLPEGLSLAEMKDYEQLASQQIGTIPEGGHKSVHWYVRGDKAGNYNLEAKLDGMIMPFEEEIHDTFVTKNSLNVWAGNALNLHFEFPSTAYYAEDYPITITLTNVSDVTLYNLHQMIEIQQGMEIYYHNGKDKIRIENSEPELTTIKEFKPGDKLIVETTVNIFFESDVMKNYLESLIGIVDKIEELIAFYDFFNVIWKLSDGFIKAMDGISKALDFKDAVLSSMDKSKKDATKKLYDSLSNLYSKYKVSDNKSINKGADLVNYGISELLDVIATGNILDYLLNLKVSDIEKLSDKVSAFAESFEPTDEEIKNFDIFDSIRTMISAIPVCFVLSDVIMTENKNNTTQIPWTYSVSEASPNYFGVTNVSSYLFDIMTACGAEAWDRASLGLLGLIPGVDDPFNYDDVKKRIIATEKEIERFQAKTATGDVTFNVHYVSNSGENDYTLTCDNETADFNNGILSFKGDGSISLIPESTAGGTLYIEDSEGRKYTYEIETVEQHKCVAGEHEIIVNSTAETNGFAVECCETCKDIMGVVELSVDDCEEHSYSEWVVESAATCTTAGAESRLCSNCGYKDLKFIEAMGHDERTVDKTEPTCTENGYTGEVVCKSCGITISTGKDIPTLGHNMSDFLVLDTPTCTNDGANISICSRCDYSEMVVVHAHGHNYIDGVCENCGDNKTAGCSCNCHKKGFMGFIWKILKVFYKLFKTNPVCDCGAAHY